MEETCARCEKLEQAFIDTRAETLKLVLSRGTGVEQRLEQLVEQEMSHLSAIVEHKAIEH